MHTAIWWIRRDLRLHDNPALYSALTEGKGVLPVFVLDPRLLNKPAEKRQAFLFAGLRALDADLRKLGSTLVIRSGEPVVEIIRRSTTEVDVAASAEPAEGSEHETTGGR